MTAGSGAAGARETDAGAASAGAAAAGPSGGGAAEGGAADSGAAGAGASGGGAGGCRAGSYDSGNPASALPSSFTFPTSDLVCDLEDRILIVDAKHVTVVSRPQLTRTRGPVARQEALGDRCDGPGGGHVGCSIRFKRFWSPVLGRGFLEFGTNAGNVLFPDGDQNQAQGCRESIRGQRIATCSTATHFVTVVYDEPASGSPRCWHLHATLWDSPGTQPLERDGDVDRAASVGDRWVFQFAAGAAGDPPVVLGFDRRARTATLEVAGQREPCVAFRLSQ